MISDGNTKLGLLPNWSVSPKATCPGRTFDTIVAGTLVKGCDSLCYVGGDQGYIKVFKTAGAAYEKNLDEVLLDSDWTVPVMRYLSKRKPKLFRIHVSGDFFSPKYIKAWESVIAMFPDTMFLAFTRSWRLPRLRKELNRVRKMDNVSMFASVDGIANNVPEGWKKAWMGKPVGTQHAVLCPGYGPKELTCDKCNLCFRSNAPNVYFPVH